ncbi:MAG: DUF1993 domain-containing protein [Sphingomonas sp.]|mgnify:CR=1 FL=1|nr:DUF1993 domain-containing protein [Sphingomonas sp.]
MTVSLFTFVDLYRRQLVTARHLLDKGEAHALAQGQSSADMLGWRLIDDMHPLGFQLMVVINFSQQWPARVAGLPEPETIGADLDADTFRAAIDRAIAGLDAMTADQFAGRDDAPLTYKIGEGMEPTLPAGQWLPVFATTNIYFHLSTVYGILRARGVPVGKVDLFASGL